MKKRDNYLNRLIALKDKSLIKVITGVRRCGKSSLLDLYEEYLLDVGAKPEDIIRMNFESLEFDDIKDYKDSLKNITQKTDNDNIDFNQNSNKPIPTLKKIKKIIPQIDEKIDSENNN